MVKKFLLTIAMFSMGIGFASIAQAKTSTLGAVSSVFESCEKGSASRLCNLISQEMSQAYTSDEMQEKPWSISARCLFISPQFNQWNQSELCKLFRAEVERLKQ